MARPVVILGAGALAREVRDVFDALEAQGDDWDVLGHLVAAEFGVPGELVNDRPILGDLNWLESHPEVEVICGVGDPAVRKRLVEQASSRGARFCTVVHPRATLTRRVDLGVGVVVTAGVILTNNIAIGDHVFLNLASTVGHDVTIAPFSNIAPGVNISGKVQIGMGAYVGTGACVIEKLRVGAWSIIGAGSTVIRDVPPNTTVVGNPGRVVETRDEGWHL